MNSTEVDSTSEKNCLELLRATHAEKVYSVGISTAGEAEIKMAQSNPNLKVVATTIDQEGAMLVSEEVNKKKLSKQVEIRLEDIRSPLPYPDDYFDFVYARLVLHYLNREELTRALKEIARILAPKSHFFVVVRSETCQHAQNSLPDPITGFRTYQYKENSYQRFFHSIPSIYGYLTEAGFQIKHIKAYEEKLSVDFARLNIDSTPRPLIEVFTTTKSSE